MIADGFDDPTITVASLQAENAIVDANVLQAGAVLDVCPGNGLDDLTGLERVAATPAVQSSGVAAQQTKLNAPVRGHWPAGVGRRRRLRTLHAAAAVRGPYGAEPPDQPG